MGLLRVAPVVEVAGRDRGTFDEYVSGDQDDLAGDGAGLGQPQRLGSLDERQSGGDTGRDLTTAHGRENLGEIGARPSPETIPTQHPAGAEIDSRAGQLPRRCVVAVDQPSAASKAVSGIQDP